MDEAKERFVCTICDSEFSRREHLQRHRMTHGSERTFQCPQCSRTFQRSDVLRRHERTHRTSTSLADRHEHHPHRHIRSRRARTACSNCATAKIRCSGGIPCDRCKRQSLNCNTPFRQSSTDSFSQEENAAISSNAPDLKDDDAVQNYLPTNWLPRLGGSLAPGDVLPLNIHEPAESAFSTAAIASTATTAAAPLHGTQESTLRPSANVPDTFNWAGASQSAFPTEENNFAFSSDMALGDSRLNLFDDNVPFQIQDEYRPMWESFPQFFWQPEEGFGPQILHYQVLQGENPAINKAISRKTRPTSPADDEETPYSDFPVSHVFARGPPSKIHYICDFLRDRSGWQEVVQLSTHFNGKNWTTQNVTPRMRDMISAKVHGLLYKSLEQHPLESIPQSFPPSETVENLIRAYDKRFSRLYPFIPPAFFHQTTREDEDHGSDTGLLLTSIISLGGLMTPIAKVRQAFVQLVYLLRTSIHERTWRDETYLLDTAVITSWMLITIFSAWSGHWRHSMNAEAYQGVFTAFFMRRGFYQPSPATSLNVEIESADGWTRWASRERDIRMSQVWYIVEQELSFFYSTPSTVVYSRFQRSMPGPDELFFSENVEQWKALVEAISKNDAHATKLRPLSLAELYNLFLRNDFLHLEISVTPLQLRLLVCVIQTQILQCSATNRCIPENDRFSHGSLNLVSFNAGKLRQEELEDLLVKWYMVYERILKKQDACQMMTACLLTYHLLWIELLICQEDVQMVVGRDGYTAGKAFLGPLRRWAESKQALKAIAHAGQVFGILSRVDANVSFPIWWPIAVLRITLTMWCYAIGLQLATGTAAGIDDTLLSKASMISINEPDERLQMHGRELRVGEGLPCLRNLGGKLVPLHQTGELIDTCLDLFSNDEAKHYPLCESVGQSLMDLKRHRLPYRFTDRSEAGPQRP